VFGIMTYDELQETLVGLHWAVLFGIVAAQYAIQHKDDLRQNILGKLIGFRIDEEPGRPGFATSLDPLATFLESDTVRNVLRSNVNLLLKQSLVRHAYEHIVHYCDEKKCLPLMQATPWYMFARIIRNTLSHKTGAHLHRWPDIAPAYVTFRGHTISKTDVGTDIVFDADEAMYLFEEMIGFARTLPQKPPVSDELSDPLAPPGAAESSTLGASEAHR
jgi:hypothetical protein